MGYLLRYQSEFTELAKSRFLDCDSCGMTQGALIRYVADRQALYMQAKQTRSDILYMTTLDTGRCSHNVLFVNAWQHLYESEDEEDGNEEQEACSSSWQAP